VQTYSLFGIDGLVLAIAMDGGLDRRPLFLLQFGIRTPTDFFKEHAHFTALKALNTLYSRFN
jgi:hypothetical protein